MTPVKAILVTDFDGTMTGRDFYLVALDHLLPKDLPNYWGEYRAGHMTHFHMLAMIYSAITASEQAVVDLLPLTRLEPELAQLLPRMRAAGWQVIVASAGCSWYIDKLLESIHVQLEVHANPGEFIPGHGLRMRLPMDSPFFSETHGINKASVVRHTMTSGLPVAFAGDGYPDLEAARLVPASLRFARAALAESLDSLNLPYQPFEKWSEIAHHLLKLPLPTMSR